MKKFFEEHRKIVHVIALIICVGLFISWFFVKETYWYKLLSLVLINGIYLGINGIYKHKWFKTNTLLKTIILFLVNLVIMTYLFPAGSYGASGVYQADDMARLGLVHLFYGFTYTIEGFSYQIGFILAVGMFYGIMLKSERYKALVARLGKKVSEKQTLSIILTTLIFAILASFLNNTLIIIAFVPFVISIYRSAGFDNLLAFTTTFGAIMVGCLGATYGSDAVHGFMSYIANGGSKINVNTHLAIRAGILALSYVLFLFFELRYAKKLSNKKSKDEAKFDDLFEVEEPKKKSTKSWPILIIFIILLIIAILGFTNWYTDPTGAKVFGIKVFNDFHEWLLKISIGKDKISLFGTIIGGSLPNVGGTLATAFGKWYLFSFSTVLFVISIIVALVSKMSVSDYFEGARDGLVKIIRPLAYVTLAYVSFAFLYFSPIMPTLLNIFGNVVDKFNPFIAAIQAFIASVFNTNFAFLGYTLSYNLGSLTDKNGDLIFLIYATIYGLVQFITPISTFLVLGLSYLNIPVKKWFQFIWKFFLIMLVCLLIVFALLAYL